MNEMLKKIICKHKNKKVICWHWTHGPLTNEIRFLEIQLQCNNCKKYYFEYIYDWNDCYKFINKYKNKQWSETCKPVLKF